MSFIFIESYFHNAKFSISFSHFFSSHFQLIFENIINDFSSHLQLTFENIINEKQALERQKKKPLINQRTKFNFK